MVSEKSTSVNNKLFYQKYHTYLALGSNLVVFVCYITSIHSRILFVSYSLDSTNFLYTPSTSVYTLIQMNVHWDRYKLTSGSGTKQLKLGTNQLSLGMKQPWAQNDWIPVMGTIELF